MPKLVFCILGPTASGKTNLAMALASQLPVDLISVDSALVYRHMNIGTAKPPADELACYPHQLIDLIDPDEAYSAAQFMSDVSLCIENSFAASRIPILVGGTMMYFQAIQQGLSALPAADESIRAELLTKGQADGWPKLHQKLADIDEQSADRIHPHDQQRIQRALEVYQLTGQPLSKLIEESQPLPFEFENILLLPQDRTWLHQRIAKRFEMMLAEGLVAETEQVLKHWPDASHSPAMRMVGYRQVHMYLQGEFDARELVEKGIAATRQLAKRQITWLRRWPTARIMIAENQQNPERAIAIVSEMLDNNRL